MKNLKLRFALIPMFVAGMLVGCSQKPAKSPDVSANIRQFLDQANFKDVSVTQDRDKGIVTLGGHVATESDKSNAESIARSIATDQVVANQIAVLTPGAESDAKTVNSELDKGIEHNLEAALIQAGLRTSVKYGVEANVVTLSGEVVSQSERARAQEVASAVPNVRQVVNELQVKNQKASSSR